MSEIEQKWKEIFIKHKIVENVRRNGSFIITAKEIKLFKEPRLMTKFDTRESLPSVFKDANLAILPNSRGSYIIGKFELYKEFPEQNNRDIKHVKIPEYLESVDKDHINSEAVAVNVMCLTGILDDFMEEDGMIATVSGRMGTGEFSFKVWDKSNQNSTDITVKNSQMEIDGGFENANIFIVLEAKSVVHSNFLVRQLFYPYNFWQRKLQKNVKSIFLVYSNNIFRLMEYEFTELDNYSSIRLVREKSYSLEDIDISLEELKTLAKNVNIVAEDSRIPFVQADSFEKVISLLEQLNDSPLTMDEIAVLFGFAKRQSGYYFNACKYLGLVEKKKDLDGQNKAFLNSNGKKIFQLSYKPKQLKYAELILQHKIFNDVFERAISEGEMPSKSFIKDRVLSLQVCINTNVAERRASSVSSWVKWILNLPTDS